MTVGSPQEQDQRFLALVSQWLVALPYDLKVLYEAKDDPNLDREAREAAAGCILHTLNPDPASDEKFISFADDTIVVRLALRVVADKGGEGAEDFTRRFEEYFSTLNEDLELCRSVMGETFDWILGKAEGLTRQIYKGKKVPQYIDDDDSVETLFQDGLAFATEYPVAEAKLEMRLKRPETLLDPLRRRALEDRKKIA
jgi:hypothetical protein